MYEVVVAMGRVCEASTGKDYIRTSRAKDSQCRCRLGLFTVLLLVSRSVRALRLPVSRRQLLDPLAESGKRAELWMAREVLPFLRAEREWLILVLVPDPDVWK